MTISTQVALSLVLALVSSAANSRCMSKVDYDKLPARWVQIKSTAASLASDRNWPPQGQEVLFYFDEPRLSGPVKGEFTRFRFGYVASGGCNAVLTGRNLNIMFPLYQLAPYEPSHWMPLTYVPK